MYMSPRQDEMQINGQTQTEGSSANQNQRLKFRTSCDSCAASKVRCTKQQHGCSRCIQNGLNCIYGRSRRKGKPPSKAVFQGPMHQRHPSPSAPPAPPAPWSTEPTHHRPGYNFDCSWYRSSMFQSTNHSPPNVDNALLAEWERRTPNSSNPSLIHHHSTPDEGTGAEPLLNNQDFMPWPNLADGDSLALLPGQLTTQRDNENLDDEMVEIDNERGNDQDERDEHLKKPKKSHSESCIATACQLLSLLTQFVGSDCHNGPAVSNSSPPPTRHPQTPLSTKEKSQTSEVVFRMTRNATVTVSRLFDCTSSFCAQDSSMLLIIGAILLKVLTWYQALYKAEIGRQAFPPTPQQGSDSPSLQPSAHLAGGKLSSGISGVDESLYTVPLTIPLEIGALKLPPSTETKMKAQLLLCEVQTLYQLCEALKFRTRAIESIRGETGAAESNAHLLRKVDDLQRVLTVVCTQVPSLSQV